MAIRKFHALAAAMHVFAMNAFVTLKVAIATMVVSARALTIVATPAVSDRKPIIELHEEASCN